MSVLDMVDSQTRKEANIFIEKLKNKGFKKRTLPNESISYPTEKALASFKCLSASKEFEKIVKETHDGKK